MMYIRIAWVSWRRSGSDRKRPRTAGIDQVHDCVARRIAGGSADFEVQSHCETP
jgi:hypothetical protein